MDDDAALSHTSPAWDQFKQLVELHKFYFEQVIRGAAFSFGAVGLVVSYVIASNVRDPGALLGALMVPIIVSFGAFLLSL
jgi:hypothetical protein